MAGHVESSAEVVFEIFEQWGLKKYIEDFKCPLWKSPEHLRSSAFAPTQKGDIYAVGLLMQTIITQTGPYEEDGQALNIQDTIEELKVGTNPPFRPNVPRDLCNEDIHYCMNKCWEEDPRARPNSRQVLSAVRRGKQEENFVDSLMGRMQKYADKLETLVEERTAAFMEEKKRTEKLLYEVLPRIVAHQLMRGEQVDPESFLSVTICFSDIVGFTDMAACSTPIEVVELLNTLYTKFDIILVKYDVYKVETIGDAYMVASGLPVRNGNNHGYEIGKMSLDMINAVTTVRAIGDRAHESVELRVGIHTGPCVGGVVGTAMPRYCLFGDTVNMASRMESTGQAQKIHISQETKDVLDSFGVFETELRGDLEVKGKGIRTTYWLTGDTTGSVTPVVVNVMNTKHQTDYLGYQQSTSGYNSSTTTSYHGNSVTKDPGILLSVPNTSM